MKFEKPLLEGIIMARPNRFIMEVNIEGVNRKAHCPVTGKIFNIDFNKSPISCLISSHVKHPGKSLRKTDFTVEAISIDPLETIEKHFIGINQIRSNFYIDHFLKSNSFPFLTDSSKIEKEVNIGSSRFDFRVGNTIIEVKTPLTIHQFKSSPSPHIQFHTKLSATKFDNSRLIKHFIDLSGYLRSSDESKSILFLVYFYDAFPFQVPNSPDKKIIEAANSVKNLGLKTYQINLKIDKFGVSLLDYFQLDL